MKWLKPIAFIPLLALMALLVVAALMTTRAGYSSGAVVKTEAKTQPKPELKSELNVLAGITPSFELTDRNGAVVKESQFRGKHVLLGFGFTHCGHICPTQVANMAKALQSKAVPAVGIFVSVDTERDTPVITDDYASKFGPAMMGLSGSYQQVAKAAENFQVSYVVSKSADSYTVQHSSSIYLLNPQGDLVDVFPFNAPPATLAQAFE